MKALCYIIVTDFLTGPPDKFVSVFQHSDLTRILHEGGGYLLLLLINLNI